MTGRYVVSPRAQSDIDDIWSYTESRWGIDQAEKYTRQLWQHIKAIAARPTSGRACLQIVEIMNDHVPEHRGPPTSAIARTIYRAVSRAPAIRRPGANA